MHFLLDTHLILWALQNDSNLPDEARTMLLDQSNTFFYSTASVWEVMIKHQIKPDKMLVDGLELSDYCNKAGFHPLPIRDEHVFQLKVISMSSSHKDPLTHLT